MFVSRAEAANTTLAQLLDRYQREITTQKRGAIMERSHLRMIGQDPVAHGFISGITGKELTAYKNRRLSGIRLDPEPGTQYPLSRVYRGRAGMARSSAVGQSRAACKPPARQ